MQLLNVATNRLLLDYAIKFALDLKVKFSMVYEGFLKALVTNNRKSDNYLQLFVLTTLVRLQGFVKNCHEFERVSQLLWSLLLHSKDATVIQS